MVTYNCEKCNKIFNHKSDYIRHINRKTPCKSDKEDENNELKLNPIESKLNPIESKINPIESKNTSNNENTKIKRHLCIYCNSSFSTNSNMSKHIKICKTKKRQDEN